MANHRIRHPKAYFDSAKGYQAAADRLLLTIEAGEGLPIRDPVHFLFAQTVELALKACLLSRGFQPARVGRAGHGISGLYDQCRDETLVGTNDPHRLMDLLIGILESGNEYHQYRYPDEPLVRRAVPNLTWTREVVGQLMADVKPHVDAWAAANPAVSAPTSTRIAFGKPTFTHQPIPERSGR